MNLLFLLRTPDMENGNTTEKMGARIVNDMVYQKSASVNAMQTGWIMILNISNSNDDRFFFSSFYCTTLNYIVLYGTSTQICHKTDEKKKHILIRHLKMNELMYYFVNRHFWIYSRHHEYANDSVMDRKCCKIYLKTPRCRCAKKAHTHTTYVFNGSKNLTQFIKKAKEREGAHATLLCNWIGWRKSTHRDYCEHTILIGFHEMLKETMWMMNNSMRCCQAITPHLWKSALGIDHSVKVHISIALLVCVCDNNNN